MAGKPVAVRGYHVCRETWHAPASWAGDDGEIDRVTVGRYRTDGMGCEAEFTVSWFQFDQSRPPLLRLRVFDGSFQELVWRMSDLMEALALVDGKAVSRQDFTAILDRLGFSDLTTREPLPHQQEDARRVREAYGAPSA